MSRNYCTDEWEAEIGCCAFGGAWDSVGWMRHPVEGLSCRVGV